MAKHEMSVSRKALLRHCIRALRGWIRMDMCDASQRKLDLLKEARLLTGRCFNSDMEGAEKELAQEEQP